MSHILTQLQERPATRKRADSDNGQTRGASRRGITCEIQTRCERRNGPAFDLNGMSSFRCVFGGMSILLRVLFETLVLRDSSLFIGSALSLKASDDKGKEAGIRCGLLQLVMAFCDVCGVGRCV